MILKKKINSNHDEYYIEINTNDEQENIVTLFNNKEDMQPLIQKKYKKTKDDDYIKITNDIVIKYEAGNENNYRKFHDWNGFIWN